METETKTYRGVTLELRPQDAGALMVTVGGHRLWVDHEELSAIVQLAYDEHGIVATPSYDLEAQAELDAMRDEADVYREVEPGRCTCGLPGCCDAAYVGEYRHMVGRVEL